MIETKEIRDRQEAKDEIYMAVSAASDELLTAAKNCWSGWSAYIEYDYRFADLRDALALIDSAKKKIERSIELAERWK